jgi:bcr-type benzoyl-CoA reductase subunit C
MMDRAWLERFEAICRKMPQAVAAWKKQTKGKAVGWMLADVPEELILAAGALPVAVLAEGVTIGEADKYFQGFACSYSRSVLELLASGKLGELDGVIIPYICDTTRALDLVAKYHQFLPFAECLRIPKTVVGEGVLPYFRQELERLAGSLAGLTGTAPDPNRLRQAIRLMNEVRSRLDRIRVILREKPGAVSAAEYLGAVRASLSLPKEEAIRLLDEFLAEAKVRTQAPGKLPRVVLAGKVAEPPAVVEMIEAAGLQVVEDALVLGGRYIQTQVAEEGDPLDNLARAQLGRWPMTGVWDANQSRGEFLLERVRAAKAQGVIFLVQKFCEPWEIDYPGLKETLDRAGIKNLRLETEYQMGSMEPLRTRVEAFTEMLA